MRLALAAAMVWVLALPVPAQDGRFESADYGIRLKLPAGWNVDAARLTQVVLKLTLPGEHPFPPEIILSEMLFPEEHITHGQYREQVRQVFQRRLPDARVLDDRTVSAGGKPGFVLVTWFKGKADTPSLVLKGIFEISPSRLLSVECVVPATLEVSASKTFDELVASVEFFPRKAAEGTPEGLKRFAEAAAKLPATVADLDRKLDLEYAMGDRKIGTYEQSMKAGTREGSAGTELSTVDVVDLGADGRLEKRTTGFASDDLSRQRAEIEIIHRGKEGRTQYFTASVAIDGTEAKISRRINGEKSTLTAKVPERTVLLELLEVVLFRMAPGEKRQVSIPVLPSFDNEAGHVKVEHTGMSEMRMPAGGVSKIQIVVVAREDGTLIHYWFDADTKLIRRAVGGQAVVLQPRK